MRRLTYLCLLLALPQTAHAACKPIKAETDILGIRIADQESAARILRRWRTPAWKGLAAEQDKNAAGADTDFPFVRLTSSDGRQDAKLFEHYGSVVGAYNEIEVRPADPARPGVRRVPVSEFATERGVKLGMRQEDLVRTLGSCFRRERGKAGEAVIVYRIEDPEHPLLKRANMPSYEARYAFKGGRLAWFRIGFEYP